MTPGARVQAAIELVTEIEAETASGGLPADRLVSRYFRRRRYAGARDRAAVSEMVYDILRHKGRLLWLIGRATPVRAPALAAEAGARALVLAALVDRRGTGDGSVDDWFAGGQYAPKPLEAAERAFAAKLETLVAEPGAMPDWARLDYPEWLDGPLRKRFGDAMEAEVAALNARAPVDIRVNTLKSSRDAVARGLRALDIGCEDCRWSATGLRLTERSRATDTDLYRRGLFELQDEGAQIASMLVDARPGSQIADLCAGAGGKSLALAAAMNNSGQIHAFDRDRRRVALFKGRMQRTGVRNTQLSGAPSGPRFDAVVGSADRVLVDVPCGGSGTWRRNPDLKWRYDESAIKNFGAVQTECLEVGGRLVRPGGRLIYVTCSLLEAENEVPIRQFLAAHAEFSLMPWARVWQSVGGGNAPESASGMADCLQLTPCRHGTDGFFVAILERLDSELVSR